MSPSDMMMCELLAIELYKQRPWMENKSGERRCRQVPWMNLHETQREAYREKAGLIAVGAIGSAYHTRPCD